MYHTYLLVRMDVQESGYKTEVVTNKEMPCRHLMYDKITAKLCSYRNVLFIESMSTVYQLEKATFDVLEKIHLAN